jgi:hypothetical protein
MDVLRSVFSRVAVQVGVVVALGALGATMIAPLGDDVVLAERLALVTPAHCADHDAGGCGRRVRTGATKPADSAGGSGEGGVSRLPAV